MKTWKAIAVGLGGAALVGLGVKAILNNKKANTEANEEYIEDNEVDTYDSAEESAE